MVDICTLFYETRCCTVKYEVLYFYFVGNRSWFLNILMALSVGRSSQNLATRLSLLECIDLDVNISIEMCSSSHSCKFENRILSWVKFQLLCI